MGFNMLYIRYKHAMNTL